MLRFVLGMGAGAALLGLACQPAIHQDVAATSVGSGAGGSSATSTPSGGSGAAPATTGGSGAGGTAVCHVLGGLDPASPWPMRGGCPTHRGQSLHAGSQSGKIAWRATALQPYSEIGGGVTLAGDGTIYAAWGFSGGSTLFAFHPDGTVAHVYPLTAFQPPAIGKDGALFAVGVFDYVLQGLSPDGTVKWSVFPFGDQYAKIGVGPDGSVFGTFVETLIAVSSHGAPVWSLKFDGVHLISSPAVAPDGTVYLVTPSLTAVTPGGAIAWERDLQQSTEGTPTIDHDGTIYVGNANHLYAFRPDGSSRWETVVGGQINLASIAIGPDGTLYATGWGNEGALYAVSTTDGSVRWAITPGTLVHEAPPTVGADGVIYAPLGDRLLALRPDGTQLWSYTAEQGCSEVAIGADGTTYAACDGSLIAFTP